MLTSERSRDRVITRPPTVERAGTVVRGACFAVASVPIYASRTSTRLVDEQGVCIVYPTINDLHIWSLFINNGFEVVK